MRHRPFIWTDELSDDVARHSRSLDPQATWIAWVCVIVGPLVVAAVVAALLRS